MIKEAYIEGGELFLEKLAGFKVSNGKSLVDDLAKKLKKTHKDAEVDISDLLNVSESYKKAPAHKKDIRDLFKPYAEIQKQKAMAAFNYKQKTRDNIVHSIDWS